MSHNCQSNTVKACVDLDLRFQNIFERSDTTLMFFLFFKSTSVWRCTCILLTSAVMIQTFKIPITDTATTVSSI